MHGCPAIVPPYILEHIRATGTQAERDQAERTLAVQHAVLNTRSLSPSLPAPTRLGLAAAGVGAPATVAVYDAHHGVALPGTLVRADADPPTGDLAVDEAHDGLRATLDFYAETCSRNSVDDAGLPLVGTVHYGQGYDNAQWTGTQMLFGDGDGTIFNRFTIAVDVMGHEVTHGVTQYTAALRYQRQSGALNESVSDVFGSLIKQYQASPRQTAEQADWLIGEGLFVPDINGVAIRSMRAPGTAYDDPRVGKDPQPATMAGYVTTSSDNGGVHINSGIPNHAFYLAATRLGGYAWDQAGAIWYAVLTGGRLAASASFAQFAQLTVDAAGSLFGTAEAATVAGAWQDVGVSTLTPAG